MSHEARNGEPILFCDQSEDIFLPEELYCLVALEKKTTKFEDIIDGRWFNSVKEAVEYRDSWGLDVVDPKKHVLCVCKVEERSRLNGPVEVVKKLKGVSS